MMPPRMGNQTCRASIRTSGSTCRRRDRRRRRRLRRAAHVIASSTGTGTGWPSRARLVQVAGDPDAVRERDLGRPDLAADVHGHRAARVESAARWRLAQVGRRAVDDAERAPIRVDVGEGAHQHLGVGVPRLGEDPPHRAFLGDATGVHDHHPVAGLGDDREVVGDEDEREAELLAQLLEQLEDLGLDHHVQCGRRLVADDDGRVAGQGHRDHRPLAHATRQLVGVGVRPRARDADPLEQVARPLARRRPSRAGGAPPSARRSDRRCGRPG